jgi:metallo-beta-lactamase class B
VNELVGLLLIALGATPAAPPSGSLDKEVIRGVIQGHLGEVRDCYERVLRQMPDLFGRVSVQFTIAGSGEVVESIVVQATTNDPLVEGCIAAAARGWRFPRPVGGGNVIVTYPFVLASEDKSIPIVSPRGGSSLFEITVVDWNAIVHRTVNAQGVPSNGLIGVSDSGLLLVDTAWTEAQTEAILTWGAKRLGRPWVGAIITHEHNDRDGGLGALQRWHIPVFALDLTVAKLEKRGVHGVTTLFTAKAGEFKDPRGFEAFYPGPGHTSDNIVISFPKVLYGGCLIKSMEAKDLGFTGDADLAHWPEAVQRVAARYQGQRFPVVPGHGAVDTTAGVFQHTLDLLAAAHKK